MCDVKLICKKEQKIKKLAESLEAEKKQLEDMKQGIVVSVNKFIIETSLNELELYNKLINTGKLSIKKTTRSS